MADDFYGYDRWKTTDDSAAREPMALVICKNDHRRMTRTPDAPCPECQAPWRIVVGALEKKVG
jgi:hypothetical protein